MDSSPGYLLPPYLLHNYCLLTQRWAQACQAAVDGKVRSEREGGREGARSCSGHIPPPPPPPAQPLLLLEWLRGWDMVPLYPLKLIIR